jgi:coiled-coil and C2 domain-containing protein 2A
MIGYTRDPRLSRIKTSLDDASLNMEQPFRDSSYITLFITIEPQLMVPEYFRESYDTIENTDLLDKIVNWSTAFTKSFPSREFKPTVMNTEGKSVIITRYFKPLKPPAELISDDNKASEKTISNIVRFVSLIPFVSDSLIFPGICDVWATCDVRVLVK